VPLLVPILYVRRELDLTTGTVQATVRLVHFLSEIEVLTTSHHTSRVLDTVKYTIAGTKKLFEAM
jgi:hypothetical protein